MDGDLINMFYYYFVFNKIVQLTNSNTSLSELEFHNKLLL